MTPVWWSFVMTLCDDRVWGLCVLTLCDDPVWPYLMALWDDRLWWSFMVVLCDAPVCWFFVTILCQYVMALYNDPVWRPCLMTLGDSTVWWPCVMALCDDLVCWPCVMALRDGSLWWPCVTLSRMCRQKKELQELRVPDKDGSSNGALGRMRVFEKEQVPLVGWPLVTLGQVDLAQPGGCFVLVDFFSLVDFLFWWLLLIRCILFEWIYLFFFVIVGRHFDFWLRFLFVQLAVDFFSFEKIPRENLVVVFYWFWLSYFFSETLQKNRLGIC